MKKRLFVFDMGGVMCTNTNVTESICKVLGISKKQFLEHAHYKNFIKIQSGKMSMNDFWHEFSERSGIVVTEDYFETLFEPQRCSCMYDLVNHLKKDNRVVAGTNTIDSHYDKHLKNGDYAVFEKVYPSNLLGVAKPDLDFYKIILKHEGVRPEETIFVDDNEQNVESASNVGINAILFKSCKDLKESLDSIL